MKIFFRLWVCLFFVGISCTAMAQPVEISGKVIDVESKEPIPFANIAIKEIYKGTASNILGEFTLKVDSLPVQLLISHLSYEPLEIVVEADSAIAIEMTPGKQLMNELVIKGKGNSDYAYNLVDKAYSKIMGRSNTTGYGKAFYRQISKNGDEYSELYEIFYDTRYSNNGLEDWAIQEGRYALKLSAVDSFIYNKNFTLMARLLTIVQPKTDDLIMPISPNVRDEYFLRVDKVVSVNDRTVAQISFTKQDEISKPAMEGEFLIDVDSYEVLKLTGTIADDKLNFITLKGKASSWKNYKVSCEIAFKEMDDDILALDYMRLGQTFDYYLNDEYVSKVETRSNLTYYEYYEPPSRKKLGGRLLRYNQRDSEMLDNIGYNQKFWDENIILKRTPIESEVITSFEEERASGSIYLNNKNQIELENYTLDSDPFIIQARHKLKEIQYQSKAQKIYVHHDKPYYAAGETIWFKAYVVKSLNNIPTSQEEILQIELLDPAGKNVLSAAFELSEGSSAGQLTIPQSLASGRYTLRAKTDRLESHDSNYYTNEIDIYNALDKSGLYTVPLYDTVNHFAYHPEGGSLVEGLPNQLTFEANDPFGNPLDVRGRLVDKIGRMVGNLKSEYNGMGSVFIMPRDESGFYTMFMSDEFGNTSFPQIREDGYSCMVNNLKPYTIDVTVNSTIRYEGKKFYLLVISNGILYDRRIGIITRGLYRAEFPKANLPNGIAQLLLLDEKGILQLKRLVYIQQPGQAFVKYYVAKKDFKPRERVEMVLELKDENGKAINNANLSVSILNQDKLKRDPLSRNIMSQLYLEYGIDKKLQHPGTLFLDSERESLKMIDYVMINQQSIFPDFKLQDSVFATQNGPVLNQAQSDYLRLTDSTAQIPWPNFAMQYIEKYNQNSAISSTSTGSENINQADTIRKITKAQVFPSPDYGRSNPGTADYRSTLYWNPSVSTNKKGRAKISFYNSDDTRNFQVILEGLSPDGLPIFDVYELGRKR